MTTEKRKFARANYPCSITLWHDDGSAEVIMANTANISVGGLCVYLNRSVESDRRLEIKIDNFFEGTPLRCFGHAVRCTEDKTNKDPRQKFYEVGIQFDTIDENHRKYLEGFVQRLLELEDRTKK